MSNTSSAAAAAEIRAIKARRGVSTRDLAEKLNVSAMWVTRRLRGHVPLTIDEIARICVALDADPSAVYAAAAGVSDSAATP